jgi:hypothetical protein
MLASLEFFAGAVVGILPTLLLSRLVLWTLRARDAGLAWLVVGHAMCWILCSLAAAPFFPAADEPYGLRAAVILMFPQLCVLLFDAARQHAPQLAASERHQASERRRLIARKLSIG